MRMVAFNRCFWANSSTIARFSGLPRAKQELPRQITISIGLASADMDNLLSQLDEFRGKNRPSRKKRLPGAAAARTAPGETAQRTDLPAKALIAVGGALVDARLRGIYLVETAIFHRSQVGHDDVCAHHEAAFTPMGPVDRGQRRCAG